MELPKTAMATETSFSKPLSVCLYKFFMNCSSDAIYDSSFVVRIRPMPAMKLLHMNVRQVGEKSENLEEPYNDNDNNYNIDYAFDFTIHWDVRIDKP
jgi:hypothetical protein